MGLLTRLARAEPDAAVQRQLARYRDNSSAETVGADSSLRLSAVYACVRLLSDLIGSMPLRAHRERRGVPEPVRPQPPLLREPSALYDANEWISQIVTSLLLRGNALGLVFDRDSNGLPTKVEIAPPDLFGVTRRSALALPDYWYGGQRVDRRDILHIRAFSHPGSVWGLTPIDYAQRTIGLGLAAERYGAKFFSESATPSGVLESDQRVSPGEAEQIKQRFEATATDTRRPVVLGQGFEWKPMSIRPDEAQFLETQRFTLQQVARVFGVPPELIGGGTDSSLDYSNREARNLELLAHNVGPWLTRIERAVSRLLPSTQYAEFDPDRLLRMDQQTQAQVARIRVRNGLATPDEERAQMGRPPLPDGQGAEFLWPPSADEGGVDAEEEQ
jgi:HK97 family phage portal protein